jgi:trans-aconitate 2-methyltransferase
VESGLSRALPVSAERDAWKPALYERFKDERSQPFFDVLALVRPRPGLRVLDLGCGTGELTKALHRRLGARETLGLDSSAAMLERTQAHAGDGLRFERGDILTFVSGEGERGAWDLVFSNAALQWVPLHEHLLGKLMGALSPLGQLAVQVPANHDHVSHAVAAEVAAEPPFREALRAYVRRSPVLAPEDYAVALDRLGFREQQVRLEVYGHRLESRDEVIEWVKGTLLTDYEQRMDAELYPRFLEAYRERLFARQPDDRPFFYPFKRILLWARR